MFDPISLIFLAIWALSSIVSIAMLTWEIIADWFSEYENSNYLDKDDIGFLTNKIKDGKFTHVQGVFNTRTGKLKDGQQIKAESVDPEIREALKRHELVIFN